MKVSKTSILTDLCKAKSIEEIDALINLSSNVSSFSEPLYSPAYNRHTQAPMGCGVPGGGGGALAIMDSTRRLRLKGLPFQAWRYIKG